MLVPYLEELGYHMEAFREPDAVEYAVDMGWAEPKYTEKGFGYYWMRRIQDDVKNVGVRTFNLSRYLALKSFEKSK